MENDCAATIAPGLELTFHDFETININATTLRGGQASCDVRVSGAGAYVVHKALAFRNRGENKDAYDLYYFMRNYRGGVEDVAARFRLLLPNQVCDEALNILRRDFMEPDAVGVH